MQLDTKIGRKLVASMVLVTSVAIVLGSAAWWTLRTFNQTLDHTVNVVTKKRTLAGELSTVASEMLASERGIVLGAILQQRTTMQESKDQFQESLVKAETHFEEIHQVLEDANDSAAIAKLQKQFISVRQAHDELLQNIEKQQFDQVQKVFDDRVLPRLLVIISEADRLVRAETGRLAEVVKDASAKGRASSWILGLLLGISVLACIPVVGVVRRINKRLRSAAAQMAEGSEQVANAATEVWSSSQSLAQGASEQAASLEETAASSEEVTSMTQRNAENSCQAAELMKQVDACVAEANRTLAEMITSMQDINASSDRISKIIKVIDEIAFQTNILALNAAVEAARAGEAGMGFAVVADEVRNLAQRCAHAAKDTADLIEESIAKSSGGSAKLTKMETAIQAITQSASKVRTLVNEVSLGSQEQARGIEHISKSISRMEAMTQKTAANAEESASASEELSAQAETMKTLVYELRVMVDGTDAARRGSKGANGQASRTTPVENSRVDAPKLRIGNGVKGASLRKSGANGHASAFIQPKPLPGEEFTEF